MPRARPVCYLGVYQLLANITAPCSLTVHDSDGGSPASPVLVPLGATIPSSSEASSLSPSTRTMSELPSTSTAPTSFEAILTAALEEYKTKTKKDIASHPLAAQLKSCDSPDAVLAILRAQVQASDKSQSANEKLTKWLDPTVNVLYAFSAILGDAVGLVID